MEEKQQVLRGRGKGETLVFEMTANLVKRNSYSPMFIESSFSHSLCDTKSSSKKRKNKFMTIKVEA